MASTVDYTLEFVTGGLMPKWTKVVPYANDAAAITEGRKLLEGYCASREPAGPASLLIGCGAERPGVRWLGAWHWDNGPCWMAA